MAKQELGRIVKRYIEQGMTTIDTATYVLKQNRNLRTTCNLTCVANISKHLSILVYFDKAIEKPAFSLDFGSIINQIETSIYQVQCSTMSLSENCLSENK